MTQIKASEVKPGMEVEWTQAGVTRKCVAETVDSSSPRYGVNLHTSEGGLVHIPGNAEVTVLAEPAPPKPEEPRWVAARAKLRDYRFFRVDESDRPWRKADCMGRVFPYRYSWRDVCSLGPVTVVPDQGWTVPDDTPEVPDVPDRIEEWPEDDTALRPYPWRDRGGYTWKWLATVSGWECYDELDDYVESGVPSYGPWTRVTDA